MRKRMRWGEQDGAVEAVEESETTLVGERKTMRQGGDLGENGRGDGGGCPLYMMGRFGHVHGHVLPHDRGLACAHVYAAPLVS